MFFLKCLKQMVKNHGKHLAKSMVKHGDHGQQPGKHMTKTCKNIAKQCQTWYQ